MRWVAAALLLIAAACSSTSSESTQGRLPALEELDGAGRPTAEGASNDGASTPEAGSGSDRATTTTVASDGSDARSGGQRVTRPDGQTAATVPAGGARPSGGQPIRVGFIVIDIGGAERVVSGYGTQVSFGDGELEARALVDDLNRRGGLLGRRVQPFIARWNPASADPGAAYVAACTKLTEDDRVFLALTPINVTQAFVDCMARHRTPLINASFNPGDDAILRQHRDWLFSPTLMSLDRGARLLLTLARDRGELGRGTKVGLVVNSADPQLPRVSDRVVKPILSQWRVPFVEYKVSGNNAANISGAVLRFATEGVNRVIFVAPNGLIQLQFMYLAEDQGFRPKYSFWDPDSPKFVSENAPRRQAETITGFGALPVSDVPPTQYPATPEEKRCLDVLRRGGEDNANRNTNLTATLYCESVWVFEAVTKRVTGPLDVSSWRAAYRAVGTQYRPVSTFAVDLASGRNDNATHYRALGWSGRCSCLTFTSPARPAPRT